MIPRAGDETDCLLNQKTRETLEREALGKSAEIGFDGAIGSLNFPNMVIL